MKGYVFSPKAKADIENIWDYTVTRWGMEQTEAYLWEIRASIETIAENPRLGRMCGYIRHGYYKYPTGSHVLFYRIHDTVVEIVRILHKHMDVDRHL